MSKRIKLEKYNQIVAYTSNYIAVKDHNIVNLIPIINSDDGMTFDTDNILTLD